MRYRAEWKRLGLRISDIDGIVCTSAGVVGHIASEHRPGTLTPGGMTTSTVFVARRYCTSGDAQTKECTTKTAAIEFLLAQHRD